MADLLLLTPELATKAVGRHVRDVLVTPVSAGDNYGSSTMRAKAITDEGDTIHLIVKSMAAPELEQQADVPMRPVFDVEGRMYEMMPRMHELLRSVNKAEPPIGPRMLYRQRDPYPMLIFEDMSVQGFRLPSRDAGLDVAHTRLVLRTIARWHAASSIILLKEPALFDNMLPIACEERLVLSDGLMVKGLARFIRNVEGSDEWSDELSKKTVAQLKRLQPTSLQRVMDAYRADPPRQGSEGVHGLHVGLHGDLWSGNILFKYDSSGQPEEARLIDYQVSNPGSPSCDLHYFFATVSGEVRRRRSELVAEYHAELAACLTAMGVRRVVSLAELQADLENRGIVEVLQVTAVTAMTMAPRSVNLSFENFVDIHNGDGPHPRDVCMAREEFRKVAKQFFAAWEEEGLLEKLLAQKKYNS